MISPRLINRVAKDVEKTSMRVIIDGFRGFASERRKGEAGGRNWKESEQRRSLGKVGLKAASSSRCWRNQPYAASRVRMR